MYNFYSSSSAIGLFVTSILRWRELLLISNQSGIVRRAVCDGLDVRYKEQLALDNQCERVPAQRTYLTDES